MHSKIEITCYINRIFENFFHTILSCFIIHVIFNIAQMSTTTNDDKNEVTVCLIGDTGMGKSSFGNLYLQDNVFEANDSTEPVTQEAIAKVLMNQMGD